MSTSATTTPDRSAEPLGPRLLRGAIGGLVFGTVFIVLNMWFTASVGNPALAPFKLISTIVLGAGAIQAGSASVPVGLAVHAVLSILFGAIFALFVPLFRTNGTVALAGGIYGMALFAVNFLIVAQTWLTQFQGPNLPVEFMAHAIFGHLLALAFYSSGARSGEPILSVGTAR